MRPHCITVLHARAWLQAYGVARYREINPTTFTIITFPFLFAVMFGDVGHALMMVAFAAFILARERVMLRQKLDDITTMIFGGRYVIFLMGVFSIFTGFMYNEFFSMPMKIAGDTRYQCAPWIDRDNRTLGVVQDRDELVPFRECADYEEAPVYDAGIGANLTDRGSPYPFGTDPIWHGTRTELTFTNSMKMKMSILMGVVQMTLGIIMSLFNHLFFRDRLSLIYEFIPQARHCCCLLSTTSCLASCVAY